MTQFRPPFSLTTLQVFVSVARLGSFTRAADHVNLTQSAVSKHIAQLEDYLGVALFVRAGGVTLTEAGVDFLSSVEPALEHIASAAQRLRTANKSTRAAVTLVAPPAVLQFWLISLLPQFSQAHPGIDLRLRPKLLSGGGQRTDVDAEIRFGSGVWQGVRAQYLFGREMCVVASPAFLRRHPVRSPGCLRDLPLLSHVLFPSAWAEWHSAMGAAPLARATQEYDHYSVMIEAIQAEFGVGIIPRLLVRKHLAGGELEAPFNEVMVGSSGYYLVLRDSPVNPAVLRLVGDWFRQQADALTQEWLRHACQTLVYSEQRK